MKLLFVLAFVVTIVNSKVLEVNTKTIKTYASLERNISIRSMPKIYEEEICGDGSYTGLCLNTPCIIRHSGTTVVNEAGISDYRRGENICQLRLDFDEFALAQLDTKGDCTTDSMQVITSRAGLSICGINNQQHLYLDFGYQPYIDAVMRIRNASKYRIRSTLIGCHSESKAPMNCLQYYTEYDGTVRSFNFPYAQLNNADYSVADYDGVKSIQWQSCRNEANPFFISGGGYGVPMGTGLECTKDWIQIYGQHRYCGRGNRPVISTVKPFMMYVRFDEAEGFSVPIDPSECDGLIIDDPYTGGRFVCTVEGGVCTCTYEPPSTWDPTIPLPHPDAENTGFCLDFAQMT